MVVRPVPKELFTAPVARPKDAPAAAPAGAPGGEPGEGPAVANLAPPSAPPAVPQPVVPKPPSLEVPLDPAAMPPLPAPQPPARPSTVSVTIPVTATGRPAPVRPATDAPDDAADGPELTLRAASTSRPPAATPPARPATEPATAPDRMPPGPPGWADPAGWSGMQEPDAARGRRWSDLADPGQPSTTIVPQRGRTTRSSRRRGSAPDVANDTPQLPVPAGDAAERSRLLSLIVFWAPAIILLVLAGVVVWVVR
jgi:hypothetical protein